MNRWPLFARILLGLALASLPFVHYRCGGDHPNREGGFHAHPTP
jgi:hypothetical protein